MRKFALFALLLAAVPAHAGPYDQLFTFGDSLVDSGNDFILTHGGAPSAAQGYHAGRFSNGYNAADYLNKALFNTYATPFLAGGTNFAFGGALAASDANHIPDLADQVGLFSLAKAGMADPNALYFINVGGNDGFAEIRGQAGAPTPAQVGQAIANAVTTLAAEGAKHFLVDNVFNLGHAPVIFNQGAAVSAYGTQVTIAINAAIAADLEGLMLPAGDTLKLFDSFAIGNRLYADPAAFGLGMLDQTGNCQAAAAYPACKGYASFDGIHPTDAVYRVFGGALVATVPEPGVLALFGLGAGMLVTARRRAR